MKNNICFIDFETSGIDVYKDSPLEIGAVLMDSSGSYISEFHSYIRPRTNRCFSKESIDIHGLRPEILLNAPTQREVLAEFFKLIGTEFRFGGWNINFDVSFFKSMCHFCEMEDDFNKINHRHLDVQSINYLLNQLNLFEMSLNSLTELSNYFSINREVRHSAIEDAKITAQIYYKLKDLLEKRLGF
jgi:DNA polymerase-3 subunit epsilon